MGKGSINFVVSSETFFVDCGHNCELCNDNIINKFVLHDLDNDHA